ncbi:MAG TPA: tRNA (guanosine(37)-N1)-methyltransferase TrmD [Candidatus Eisenbergiella merdipullorum]|uniref:tRNA (guanine-N(1)-)-methyltransferase n=1 Tax=Candidatus Eisenbergiella merdipullorum TaxID=2838553 RepID=A0A9D2I7W6_9FIRM|nr:tRNA (guanosine(37)-N1)-methyltransferase TrmD [Candidatus Eisenbergiella merdipullorum]
MHFHVLTLFPEMVSQGLSESILGRAARKGCIELETVNIRDYTINKHKKVDDYPYGGGAGMLMQAQPVFDACMDVEKKIEMRRNAERTAGNAETAAGIAETSAAGEASGNDKDAACREKSPLRVIYVTPQGKVFTQQMAQEFAREEDLIFLCGHYEGVDERVLEEIVTDYVSIGDYVLTGGELPAMVMIDAISRMVPGVLKNEESAETESFCDGLLEYPQYTRPEVWKDRRVPSVLLSGDHVRIEKWRLEQSLERTRQRRPGLYEAYTRRDRAVSYLSKDRLSHMDMLEVIKRGQADVVRAEETGVLLYDRPSGAWMLSASDEDMGERLLSEIPRGKDELFAVHQSFLKESIARRFHRDRVSECMQAVYARKLPPACRARFGIRPLEAQDVDAVYENYHAVHSRDYLLERIEAGEMFGIDADGRLAAFAGMHDEGSMGMLEVLPEYRRMGMAEALEAYLITQQLEKGYVPFCQIFDGNEPSLCLQKKLGLKIASGRLYWIS